MTTLKPLLLAACLTVAGLTPGSAAVPSRPHHIYLVGSLRVTQPWIDVAHGSEDDTAGYLIVENRSNSPDRLTGASLDGAASVVVVNPEEDDGALTVPPRSRLILKPGDVHLELHGLHGLTENGPPVAGVLRFERSGSLHLSFATNRSEAIDDDQSAPSLEDKPVDLKD